MSDDTEKCPTCKHYEGVYVVNGDGQRVHAVPPEIQYIITVPGKEGKVSIFACSNQHVFSVWNK